ncbi:pseudouridine synthase [Ancylomarina euxinus]|uniref:Pseudouridine synthase n=1 Tax=Ancylomarina euxinus TaxID=2283627 RepID=A0A425XYA5_9BACT|nr:pseudouridine synthase [Ancylomarina euxinus]MCZ4695842.1 pseudouridine synthase [Ancylomarina euxinus]MUP16094.1 pseudouridine synthase [Ancylomarina euxinus]RRG19815.1 pseudouridine synthase [Ancylomarina euxinus]
MEDKKYGNKQRGKQSFRSSRNEEGRFDESKFNRGPKSSEKGERSDSEFSHKKADRAAKSDRAYQGRNNDNRAKRNEDGSSESRVNRAPRSSDSSESTHKKNKKAYRGKNQPTPRREEKRPSGLRVGKSVVRQEKDEFSHKGTERSYKDRKRFQHRDNVDRSEETFEKKKVAEEGEDTFQVKSRYSKKKQLEYNRLNGPADGMLRLNKFIANSGVCSRREADKLIVDKQIMVNGITVTEVGTKVSKDDDVRLDGVRLMAEAKVYLLMNKPKDFVTTLDDPTGRKTVMDLIGDACEERIYPVGRLDRDTTGVLLFTNDGNLTKKLTHPSYERKKIYHVHLDRNISRDELLKIADGLELEDGFIQADEVSYVDPKDKSQVGIEIHSGKNRIVRRIFEHLGYKVEKLDRVYFAGLTKKNLPRGKFRFLTQKEINILTHY